MTKSAIIHVRTTDDRKKAMAKLAKENPTLYTQTKIVEEGVDIILERATRIENAVKKTVKGKK